MTIAFVGYEGKGAWQIRAKQIAPLIEARVDPLLVKPTKCKAVILIKMPENPLLARIRKFNLPIIWDPQDCWPQNDKKNMSNNDRDSMLEWFDTSLKHVNPQLVIAASSKMQEDCISLGFKSEIIHHHCRPKIKINPIREQVSTVGIEGTPKQIGNWASRLENICKSLGFGFAANLDATRDALHTFDILVSQREHTGYASKNWKSNVKLANAHGSGTPSIFTREQSYTDTALGCELWADTEDEIVENLLKLKDYELRKSIHEKFLTHTQTIDNIANQYKQLINKFLN